MPKPLLPRLSLQTRLAMVFLGMACALLAGTISFFYTEASQVLLQQLQDKLITTAAMAEAFVDADTLIGLHGEDDPGYKRLQKAMATIKGAHPSMRYLYTMYRDAQGVWHFGVDATPKGEEGHSAFGEVYPPPDPAILDRALHEQLAQDNFETDSYGTWLSAYAPVLKGGKPTGHLIGVDMSAEMVRHEESRLRAIAFVIFAVGLFASLGLSMWLARVLTRPVAQLVEGTRKVAEGNLAVRVPDKRRDELGDLARSFNAMIGAIAQHHEELKETERMAQELATARRIQQAMLPAEAPRDSRLNIDFYLETSTEVGGDYFDFVPVGEREIALVIGDVTGHGVPAALLMAIIKSCIHTQVISNSSVASVMEIANNLLHQSRFERRFMTFFYSILDTSTGLLRYANAGHLYPFLFRNASRTVETLEMASYPLGVRPKLLVSEREVTLATGDVLVFYSDGIIEAKNEDGEEFGFERMEQFVLKHGHLSAEVLKEKLLEAWRRFVFDGTAPLDFQPTKTNRADDDVTIVVVKFAPSGRTAPLPDPAASNPL